MAEAFVKYVASLLWAAMLRPLKTRHQWYVLLIIIDSSHCIWLSRYFYAWFAYLLKNITAMFSACQWCGLIPIHGTLNDHGLRYGCHDKRKCRMCGRYLGPHLYSDGDGSICNACVKKSTQRGGATAYKALRDTIEEHVIDGGDDPSLEFFIHFNNEAIRRILQNSIDINK